MGYEEVEVQMKFDECMKGCEIINTSTNVQGNFVIT